MTVYTLYILYVFICDIMCKNKDGNTTSMMILYLFVWVIHQLGLERTCLFFSLDRDCPSGYPFEPTQVEPRKSLFNTFN